LMAMGLIRRDADQLVLTELGRATINMLLSVNDILREFDYVQCFLPRSIAAASARAISRTAYSFQVRP
jgi:hypothetical protein